MPMPTGGAWPPKHLAPAYDAYREWDAWYAGDPQRLMDVYGATGQQNVPPSQRVRPGQLAGGLVGAVSRFLWGAPPPITTADTRLHVPLAADLCSTASALLFSEPPKLMAAGEGSVPAGVQARLDELVEQGLWSTMRHAAEAASALGDVYLRPVIDREVSPKAAIVAPVHADGAIPVIRWGHLVEVTFWSELSREANGAVLRLLEHHAPGFITYALHVGTHRELGRAVPLTEHPEAKPLAGLLGEDGRQATGIPDLDVVRVPNAGPQRRWRRLAGGLRYLGRSDLDQAEPLFDQIDAVWTSWMRDIRLARGRVTVPGYMLEDLGPGKGAFWDADREVYSAVNMAPGQTGGSSALTVSQFAIRHVEHKATLDELVETAYRHAGLSGQTLGDQGGDVAMTATEAQARERLSYITRGDRTQTWGAAMARYIELHLATERAARMSTVDPVKPHVEWGDSVSESPETVARTVQLLAAAEAISVETRVRLVHPEWDDDQVQAEVAAIRADSAAPPPADPAESANAFADGGLPPDPLEA